MDRRIKSGHDDTPLGAWRRCHIRKRSGLRLAVSGNQPKFSLKWVAEKAPAQISWGTA
jgi:hypothetical protein